MKLNGKHYHESCRLPTQDYNNIHTALHAEYTSVLETIEVAYLSSYEMLAKPL